VHGDTLELAYRGKSGVARRVQITDRRLARIVQRCRALPGARLFQYADADGIHAITSNDVNAYLHTATGGPFTAKDYRTWAATLGATWLLCGQLKPASQRECKRCIKRVIDTVAHQLGHTPAVCRKSYIHPRVLDDFAADKLGVLARQLRRRAAPSPRVTALADAVRDVIAVDTLRAIEPAVARYLGASLRQRRVA
jgi:DNA topoisomerase-1